jgi:hypothetical protein
MPVRAHAPQAFLAHLKATGPPKALQLAKWRPLYKAFIHSPHFWPWFRAREQVRRSWSNANALGKCRPALGCFCTHSIWVGPAWWLCRASLGRCSCCLARSEWPCRPSLWWTLYVRAPHQSQRAGGALVAEPTPLQTSPQLLSGWVSCEAGLWGLSSVKSRGCVGCVRSHHKPLWSWQLNLPPPPPPSSPFAPVGSTLCSLAVLLATGPRAGHGHEEPFGGCRSCYCQSVT